MTVSVPVLLITGPVGVGKTTVAAEAARLLREADIAHALVDLAWIEQCWPVPADDPWNERLTQANLACMWANFQQAGAGRLIVVRVLEARSLLRRVAEAVPGAAITVIRLRAPLPVLHARIRSREAGDPGWFLGAATHTANVLEQARIEDHLVDNQDRPVAAVAAEVLRRAEWLDPSTRASHSRVNRAHMTVHQTAGVQARLPGQWPQLGTLGCSWATPTPRPVGGGSSSRPRPPGRPSSRWCGQTARPTWLQYGSSSTATRSCS